MRYDFYAYMDRMKYIKRWSLMRSVREENIMEHSQQVAFFAHALAIINRKVMGGNADAEKTVLYAVYHECSEVLTGDLPTPIKYLNDSIRGAYKEIESKANERLLSMLPDEMREEIAPYVSPKQDELEYKLVKAADRLAAYVKCLEEARSGNNEFVLAEKSIKEDLLSRHMPEVDYFFEHFIAGFSLTLDELSKGISK
jgi:5'-deoxynucleotidase